MHLEQSGEQLRYGWTSKILPKYTIDNSQFMLHIRIICAMGREFKNADGMHDRPIKNENL